MNKDELFKEILEHFIEYGDEDDDGDQKETPVDPSIIDFEIQDCDGDSDEGNVTKWMTIVGRYHSKAKQAECDKKREIEKILALERKRLEIIEGL